MIPILPWLLVIFCCCRASCSRHLSEMARFDRSCKNVTTSASIGSLVEAYFCFNFRLKFKTKVLLKSVCFLFLNKYPRKRKNVSHLKATMHSATFVVPCLRRKRQGWFAVEETISRPVILL